jgi:hypothetical protein
LRRQIAEQVFCCIYQCEKFGRPSRGTVGHAANTNATMAPAVAISNDEPAVSAGPTPSVLRRFAAPFGRRRREEMCTRRTQTPLRRLRGLHTWLHTWLHSWTACGNTLATWTQFPRDRRRFLEATDRCCAIREKAAKKRC